MHTSRVQDRSGLGVPAFAARAARGTEERMRYLDGHALPSRRNGRATTTASPGVTCVSGVICAPGGPTATTGGVCVGAIALDVCVGG
jgi:hypothetical protein